MIDQRQFLVVFSYIRFSRSKQLLFEKGQVSLTFSVIHRHVFLYFPRYLIRHLTSSLVHYYRNL